MRGVSADLTVTMTSDVTLEVFVAEERQLDMPRTLWDSEGPCTMSDCVDLCQTVTSSQGINVHLCFTLFYVFEIVFTYLKFDYYSECHDMRSTKNEDFNNQLIFKLVKILKSYERKKK